MGVSAVPGSGKTVTLSALTARLVVGDLLGDDQEVLVVTLVNSAVDNFAGQVAHFIAEQDLLPHIGYRVRTLHGLAHDIVRERPDLVGLADDFQIVDEREAHRILQDAAETWVKSHPEATDGFLALDLDERQEQWARRDLWPELVTGIALNFIRQAKDLRLTPVEVRDALDHRQQVLTLAEMGWAVFADYQRALAYRGAVDFDDLIRLALEALERDQELLDRLRGLWPYVLEDEAQDSSRLQEEILQQLASPAPSTSLSESGGRESGGRESGGRESGGRESGGRESGGQESGSRESLRGARVERLRQRPGQGGNWVRVGDPNQAIYETFTTASPDSLREFLCQAGVDARTLPNSGRSSQSIIDWANFLIDWTRTHHPVEDVRGALTLPHIEPAPPGDPQPNPPDDPDQVRVVSRRYTPAAEIKAVADSLERWLPEHPEETVAVLVPRNRRGFQMVNELKERGIGYVELLRSTRATRETAGALGNILNYLADPLSPSKLARVYRVWRRDDRQDPELADRVDAVAGSLRRCTRTEDFLWPRLGRDWLDEVEPTVEYLKIREHLEVFRQLVRRWQEATLLPVDQLILTLAQDLFREPADLALAHKLALLLGHASERHADWRLPELTGELAVIARNERRFIGLGDTDTRFDAQRHRGKVVVATIHKAKGLEWDRVYLMSVNNYNFPSGLPHDQFMAERWFVRDSLNLEAEALAQLDAAVKQGDGAYQEGQATERARLAYAAERMRLLYVGVTRARRELIITWNAGRRGDLQAAVPVIALQTFWERSGRL